MPSSKGSSKPRDETHISNVSCIGRACSLPLAPPGKSLLNSSIVLLPQSCLNLCDPIDCSPPGSSVHGILQARILEWIAILFFRGSSWPRDRTQISLTVGRRFTIWATREVQGWLGLWWGGTSIPWSTHFTKVFLLVFRIWSHHEGIQCFSRYEEMQGLRSQNLFLKTSKYL